MSKLGHFQGWQVGRCWLLVGSLCSFSYGPLHGQLEYPHNTEAGFPLSEWSKRKQGKSCNAFYDLTLEVTHHHFCCVYCSHRPSLIPRGRGLHKGLNTRTENHWRPSWKLATTYGEDFTKRSSHQELFVLWVWEKNRSGLALLVLDFFLFVSCLPAVDMHSACSIIQ